MLAYDGSPAYIYNPYSLAQLKAKLNNPPSGLALDAYLQCVADGGSTCAPPPDPVVASQQVGRPAPPPPYPASRASSA